MARSPFVIRARKGPMNAGVLHTDHGGRFTFTQPDYLMMNRRNVGRKGKMLTFRTRKAAESYVEQQGGILRSLPYAGYRPSVEHLEASVAQMRRGAAKVEGATDVGAYLTSTQRMAREP